MAIVTAMLEPARHRRVRYRSRQMIYDEGEVPTAIFRVEAGCVRLQVNGSDGHRQIVAFLFRGDMFGVCVAERSSAAEAVTDVELTRYSLPSILQLSSGSHAILTELIHSTNTLFNGLAHHLDDIAHLPAAERVLRFLTWLVERQGSRPGETVRLPMTLRDVSDFLALSPETLSRTLRELQDRGSIVLRGRRAFAIVSTAFAGPTRPQADQIEMQI